MKEIIKITASLTAVCVAAALILGAVFAKTEHARKEIEEKTKNESIQGLLGFGGETKAPEDLKIYPVYRYVIKDAKGATTLGYVLPVKDKGYTIAQVDLTGKPGQAVSFNAEASQLVERETRDPIIAGALKGSTVSYADTVYVANLGGKRLGYVVPGVTQGFKNFVKFMVSLNPEFVVTGLAITESEEDPGLGAEIQKDFFRNQFKGKTLDVLKDLKVVKEPLPSDYLLALDPAKGKKAGMAADKLKEIKEKHLKDDIYALTGATISTRAVTDGVKDTVRKFVYRQGVLNGAIKQDNIQVAF